MLVSIKANEMRRMTNRESLNYKNNSLNVPLLLLLLPLLALILQAARAAAAAAADPREEALVEFPDLLPDASSGSGQVKIISESDDSKGNYATSEEYIDVGIGRAALVLADASGAQPTVGFSDAHTDGLYVYWPYECKRFGPSSEAIERLNYWYQSAMAMAPSGRSLRLFNVAAAWLYAKGRPKAYRSEPARGSRPGPVWHTWTLREEESNQLLEFTFRQDNNQTLALSSLRLYELEAGRAEPLRSIKVLLVDYTLELGERESLLQLPVGFGCLGDESNWKTLQHDLELTGGSSLEQLDLDLFWASFVFGDARVELEVSALDVASGQGDTLLVELAHLVEQSSGGGGGLNTEEVLTLVHVKRPAALASETLEGDTKTISDYEANVRYFVNPLAATCKREHISQEAKREADVWDASLLLRFSNGLEFSLKRDHLRLLFEDQADWRLVKQSARRPSAEEPLRVSHFLYHLERSFDHWPPWSAAARDSNKFARLVRVYEAEKSELRGDELGGDDGGQREWEKIKLLGVKLLIFDSNSKPLNLLQVLQFSLTASESPLEASSRGQLFDVSQECFAKSGEQTDEPAASFAWLRINYPLDWRQLDQLAQSEAQLRQLFRQQLIEPLLGHFRAPRLEFQFASSSLVARLLVLDEPPLELAFEPIEGVALQVNGGRDSVELAPDLGHCARQCRANSCQSFTFCSANFACLLGSLPVELQAVAASGNSSGTQRVRAQEFCTTYTSFKRSNRWLGLAELMAWLGEQQLDARLVPEAPEELRAPRSQTGLSEAQLGQLVSDYNERLDKFVENNVNSLPAMSFRLLLNGHVIVATPSKYELENNSQEENWGQEEEERRRSLGATFHAGLSNFHFKLGAFQSGGGERGGGDEEEEEEQQVGRQELAKQRATLLQGLSYEQCAGACLDAKCGSFSHCAHSRECLLTSLATVGQAQALGLLEQEPDCLVMQRDFLRDFQRFPNVAAPQTSSRRLGPQAHLTPADCALSCANERTFNCLSFEHCAHSAPDSRPFCLLQSSRFVASSTATSRNKAAAPTGGHQGEPSAGGSVLAKCDHYSRSQLADFVQLEHRQLSERALGQAKAALSLEPANRWANQCANSCAARPQCSAFEYCVRSKPAIRRECRLVESSLIGPGEELEPSQSSESRQSESLAKLLEFSPECSVFAMRKFTSQSHLRELALGQVAAAEEMRQESAQLRANFASEHLSLAACLLVLALSLLISSTLTSGLRYLIQSERAQHLRSLLRHWP